MSKNNELPPYLLQDIPWTSSTNPIWPATSFILQRNLSSFNFPTTLTDAEFFQVLDLLKTAFLRSTTLEKPQFLRAEETSPLDKEYLYEHFLCPESFQNTLAGQAFLVDATSRFLCLLNLQDHIQFQILDWTAEPEKVWERLWKIESEIGSFIDFAYTPRFGYLTSDYSRCGTALTGLIYLHVPGLIHTEKLPDVLEKQKDDAVTALSIEGKIEDLAGDLLVLSNTYILGVTEESIFHSLQSSALKLIASEKAIREKIKKENNLVIKDKIARAYGLLINSLQLQTKESLNALSLLKLGVDLGWVTGITDSKINELLFTCRRAHLTHFNNEHTIDIDALPKKRAEFLHAAMQNVKLI